MIEIQRVAEGDQAFRRMFAACQPLAHLWRHRHVVTGLTPSFTDDYLEFQKDRQGDLKRFVTRYARFEFFSGDRYLRSLFVAGALAVIRYRGHLH